MPLTIREARTEDSPGLTQLVRLTPMQGLIGLRTERNPDFFELLRLSLDFILLVAVDGLNEIRGCFAATKNNMRVSGGVRVVYYLRDLKVHPESHGSMVAFRLVREMYKRLIEKEADILCCTMASGNEAVVPFFGGRAGIPPFSTIGRFNVYQILPAKKKLNEEERNVAPLSLADFYNRSFETNAMAPERICHQSLKACVSFSASEGEEVVAAISAFDPYKFKQNIVTTYSWSVAAVLSILKVLKIFFYLPELPKKNIPLRILYARYIAFLPGKHYALKNLIAQLREYASGKNFHLVAIAAEERDEGLNKMLKPLTRFVFKSTLLATSLQNNQHIIDALQKDICYEDYSLV